MKIIEIKDLIRKDVPIYYKRFYKGTLVLDMAGKNIEEPVEFIIEHKPTGQLEISATVSQDIDYPLVPLMKELKSYIAELDAGRKLPV